MRHAQVPFADRRVAGRELGAALAGRRLPAPPVVLGLPRGGVPVAFEVAQVMHAPLDVLPVRKVGAPWQPEYAMGAVAAGGITVTQPAGSGFADTGPGSEFAGRAERERRELERRSALYRAGRPPLALAGRCAVLVDDGLATGATMLAAARAARHLGAAAVLVATPVASREAIAALRGECDEVVVLHVPPLLQAVGEWYVDFAQVEDEEVLRLLAAAHPARATASGREVPHGQ